jgi:hypothetical protein
MLGRTLVRISVSFRSYFEDKFQQVLTKDELESFKVGQLVKEKLP